MNTTVAKKERRVSGDGRVAEAAYITPEVNIFETKDGYVLQAEMPGVDKEGLEITLEGNDLTIVGRRQLDSLEAELLYRESRPRDYRRTFELDPAINTAKIDAKMEQDVLTLHIPRQD